MNLETRPEKMISRRKLIARGIAGLAGLTFVDGIAVERKWLSFQTVEIPLKRLPRSFDGYRIAQLSDFHYPNWITPDFIGNTLEMAYDFKPDLIALTGDFVHAASTDRASEVPDIASLFAKVHAPDGVFGVLGNHDYWLNADGVKAQLAKTPVRLLENESVILKRCGDSLAILGLPDLWEGPIHFERAFSPIPKDMPVVLLQHNPDLAEVFPAQYKVDLQLSGHTHGGQIRIPFGPALILPSKYGNKYREGLVQGPSHPVYVTRGVGVSSIPLRIFCRPEVTGLILRSV